MLDLIKDTFNEVYLLIYFEEYHFMRGDGEWANEQVKRTLLDFISKMPETAGEDWLRSFIVFQFAYYDGMKTRFDRPYLNWIFGDKALKRWDDRTEEQVYYALKFKARIGLRKPYEKLLAAAWKATERQRFEATPRQVLHCDENALFDDNCNGHCTYYEACKKHFVCHA